jgi:hypothetical protein
MADEDIQVRRRRVLYVPGYDPFHARRYRELYRREARLQSARSGHGIAVRADAGGAGYGWRVEAEVEGARVETAVEVLTWTDIVRDSMLKGVWATYRHLALAAAVYIGSGALFRLARLRKGPMIAGLYPAVLLVLQLALAAGAGWLAARGAAALLPAGGAALELAAFALAGLAVLLAFRRLNTLLMVDYLMNDLAFSIQAWGAYPPAVEARLSEFARRIDAALAEDVDEVLVVGHSIGTHLAVSALAERLRAGPVPPGGPVLSLLTLGQTIPMMSFLPRADRLRADLALLSVRDDITWVDVSAPGDGVAFALCDPVAVSGVAGPGKRWPLVISAAFRQTLRPETWARLRWRFFRLHFQYLCAFDALRGRPDDYDYFAVTAGPRTLAGRFGAKAPSPARVETPASGFTSMAA